VPGELAPPRRDGAEAIGTVVTIDHFGNLLTNLDAALLAEIAAPAVHVGGMTLPLGRTYGDAGPGEYLALVNSFGVLEIARCGLSAADGLGLQRGAPVVVRGGAQE